MSRRRTYRKKTGSVITAVKLDLVTDGFKYQKWGSEQHCKPGDWLANNQGDTYTIDASTFTDTYERVSPGVYRKTSVIWAEQAQAAGVVTTKEGVSAYVAGDYIVSNNEDGTDGYTVPQSSFLKMYEPTD